MRVRSWLAITFCLHTAVGLWAAPQDPRPVDGDKVTAKSARGRSVDSHSGSSPFHPLPTGDTSFVVDTGPGLDTGCSYRSDGPLVFDIPITRYVGEANADGTLANPSLLVSNQVVSRYAKLLLPVYDVDYDATPTSTTAPERDIITLNGKNLGASGTVAYVTGSNNTWKLNEFRIPIEILKFPKLSSTVGAGPVAAKNTVRIDIDTANVANNKEAWCTAVDWAQLTFGAMAPILLIHGTNAQSTTWDGEPVNYLTTNGYPFHHRTINMAPNGSSDNNAAQLAAILEKMATWFGAKSFHLVGHSKGATDSRRFLNLLYKPDGNFKILSLTSVDTPSRGTILSDVAIASEDTTSVPGLEKSNDPDVASMMRSAWWGSWLGTLVAPADPARRQQTIAGMRAFNAANPLYPGVRYFSIAADADVNGDGKVDDNEGKPLVPGVPGLGGTADLIYRVLGNVGVVTITQRPVPGTFGLSTYNYATAIRRQFQPNDLTATVVSAHYDGFEPILTTKANHSNIKRASTMDVIVKKLRESFPLSQ